ncbi:MAG: DNA polymerase III subunit gamma/tau, partial [Lacipirellulaceae bacterium]
MSDTTAPNAINDGDYVVVARRYRPQAFEELIGQQHVAKALTGAIASDRVGHAYIFTGARGVGKTSAARILAKALNCVQGPAQQPCNECEICESVSSGDDVDVLEIDGASNRGIDEIRQLRQNVAVRPSRARFKIYIIDEVHMLTKEAFNALLKTLEEPPEHVKFIFATTEPNKIPITILSRCQRYDFAGIETTSIQNRLAQIAAAERVEVEDDALQILAMRAAGSMRDSQSLLEQLLSTGSTQITTTDVTELLGIAPAS